MAPARLVAEGNTPTSTAVAAAGPKQVSARHA